jgi:hypothetical protein
VPAPDRNRSDQGLTVADMKRCHWVIFAKKTEDPWILVIRAHYRFPQAAEAKRQKL